MRRKYEALGWWKVTTQGDCEGRTVKNLGVHFGYLDEIAFRFGRMAEYSICLQAIDEPEPAASPEPVDSVIIQLGIDSGTWDGSPMERAEEVRKILANRPVIVGESSYYASMVLKKC